MRQEQTSTRRAELSRHAGWTTLVVGRPPRVISLVLAMVLAGAMGVVVFSLTGQPVVNLTAEAEAALDDSGVTNPVTAVLLNYRAMDTWLELVILWLAMVGAMVLLRADDLSGFGNTTGHGEMLPRLAGVLIPLMAMTGGYLLWRGTHGPGGAFQAGALWAAGGVVARLSGVDCLHRVPGWLLRSVYTLALVLFMWVGLMMLDDGGAFMQWPTAWAGELIFVLEVAATVSIAAALWSLVVVASPGDEAVTVEGDDR
ncbi:MnhB domain-containing protein [Phycisphaerales bacterium AB-hyl4]|uniref:MnhB domain-containing protein n=1 Tax=Natronomicrosphaera hydrolytica TaxID=3242702 RepID=A0ABV4U7U9_9BACT